MTCKSEPCPADPGVHWPGHRIGIEFRHLVDPAIFHTEPYWPIGLANHHNGATPVTVGLLYYSHFQHGLKLRLNNFRLVFRQPIVLTTLSRLGVSMWWCMRLVRLGRGESTLVKRRGNEATSAVWLGERWSSTGTGTDWFELATSGPNSSLSITVVARETAITSLHALRRLRW